MTVMTVMIINAIVVEIVVLWRLLMSVVVSRIAVVNVIIVNK